MTTDTFRRKTFREVGIGGINCPCCGPAPGKARKAHRRRTRRRLRQADRRELRARTSTES